MANKKTTKSNFAELEAQTRDVAYKIWLAGVGAYGRAFEGAAQGAAKVAEGSTEMFDDLVKRGAKIESEMKTRLSKNDALSRASDTVAKAAEVVTDFQEKATEQLEARMERMRSLLGLPRAGDATSALHTKIDRLEDEIADLSVKKTAKAKAELKALKARLSRLSAEIAVAEGKAKAKAKPVKKTAVKGKTTAKKTVAKKTAAKKTTAKKTAAKRPAAKKTAAKKASA